MNNTNINDINTETNTEIKTKTKEENGRELWKTLHLRAYNHKGGDDSAFIREFTNSIPQYMTGCKCSEHWNKWLIYNRPRFDTKYYFAWTVKAHNAVNYKLRKKQLTLAEAEAELIK